MIEFVPLIPVYTLTLLRKGLPGVERIKTVHDTGFRTERVGITQGKMDHRWNSWMGRGVVTRIEG